MLGRPVARCLFSFSPFGRGFLGESGLHVVEGFTESCGFVHDYLDLDICGKMGS